MPWFPKYTNLKVPCSRDCPNRSAHCHAECELYKNYRKCEKEGKDRADAQAYIFNVDLPKHRSNPKRVY